VHVEALVPKLAVETVDESVLHVLGSAERSCILSRPSAKGVSCAVNGKTQAVSLFSGAGGMDLGVTCAGFDILACIEKDPNCCSTLRANSSRLGESLKVLEADIRSLDPEQLLDDLGIRRGTLDLLFGGPPCQAFSQIGKQNGLGDERGLLVFEMVRFAEALEPRTLFIEQVPGFGTARDAHGARGGVLDLLLSDLSAIGYTVKWKILNAADYGIPQLRKRLFLVATQGKNGFAFPEPTHGKLSAGLPGLGLPQPYVTVGEAIDGLGEPSPRHEIGRRDSHIDVTPDGDRRRIHGVPEGECLAAQLHLPAEQRGRLSKKDTTKFRRLDRRKPSNTLRGGEAFYHPIEDRYLTPRECMRIHGFPDDYVIIGPIKGRSGSYRNLDQHRQVANAVPPPLAEAIAAAIRSTVLCQPYLRSSATT